MPASFAQEGVTSRNKPFSSCNRVFTTAKTSLLSKASNRKSQVAGMLNFDKISACPITAVSIFCPKESQKSSPLTGLTTDTKEFV